MLGDSYASAMVAGNVVVCLLCLAAAAVLVSRPPYSVLDLWLMVVVLAWMYAAALSTVLDRRSAQEAVRRPRCPHGRL